MQRPRTPAPQQPGTPLAFASNATVPPSPVSQDDAEEKNWGPLKPIRKVPKPSDAKAAYILAQSEHVVLPEEDASRRKNIIIGSIVGFVLIAGGSFAFIKYGRDVSTVKTNTVQVVNMKVGNVNTSNVFPAANTNANANTASSSNVNSGVDTTKYISTTDTDSDRIPDEWETYLGTDPVLKDTDEDGYTDRSEIGSGYSPKSAKKIAVSDLLSFCDNFLKKNSTIFTASQRETICAKNGTVLQKAIDTPPPARFENVVQLEYNSQYDALQTWCEKQFPASTADQNAAVRRTTCQYNSALIIPGMFQFLSLDEPIARSAPAI